MTPRPGPFRSPGGEGASTAPPARGKPNLRSASIGGVLRILLAGLVPVAAGITFGAPAQAFDFVHQGAFSDASGVTDGAPTGIVLSLSTSRVHEPFSSTGTTTTTHTVTATLTGGGTRTEETRVSVEVGGASARPAGGGVSVKDARSRNADYVLTFSGTNVHVCPRESFPCSTQGTIYIPAGMASGTLTFELVVLGDILHQENDESLTFSGMRSAGLEVTGTSLTITNAANIGAAITLGDPVSTGESDAVTLTATLDNAVEGGFTVEVSTTDGSATAGEDYTAPTDPSRTLTFVGTPDEEQTFMVQITPDTVAEGDETFTVGLSGAGGAPGQLVGVPVLVDVRDTTTVTITDNDTATVTLADVSVGEGEGPATVVATLDNAVQGGFTVEASTEGVTATAGSDYTEVTGHVLTFMGNADETQSFPVPIEDDDVYGEADETFRVSLGNLGTTATAMVTITDTALVTIADNDEPPPVTLGDRTVGESGGPVTVTATLNVAIAGALTVTVETVDGMATAEEDYTALPSMTTFMFPAGTLTGRTRTFQVPILPDTVFEGDEAFTVRISGAGGEGAEGLDISGMATVTITDDDDAPTGVVLSLSTSQVNEPLSSTGTITTTHTVTATLTGGGTRAEETSVSVEVDGTARGGRAGDNSMRLADYVLTFDGTDFFYVCLGGPQHPCTTQGTIYIPARTASVTLTFKLVVLGDIFPENDESLIFSGTHSAGLPVADTDAILTIVDAANIGAVITLADPDPVLEGGAVTLTATLNTAVQGGFTVAVSTTDGSATAEEDYTALSGHMLTFVGDQPNEEQTFTVQIAADTVAEGDETFTVGLSGVGGAPVPVDVSDTATVTITDDDDAPTGIGLSLSPGSVTEGSTGSTTTTQVTVRATLTGGGTRTVSTVVAVTVAGGTATAGVTTDADTDFGTVDGFDITIPVGMASATWVFDLEVVGDTQDEGNETVTVSGSADIGASEPATAMVDLMITDDDDPPTEIGLSLSPGSVTEGSTGSTTTTQVTVRATLTGGGTRTVSTVVAVTVAGGTATAGVTTDADTDFGTVDGFDITIPVGMASATGVFNLEVVGDTQDEGNETVSVSGSADIGASEPATAMVDLMITDDDDPPTEIGLSISPGSVTEGSTGSTTTTQVTVRATLTGGGTRTVSTVVAVTVAGGTATAGVTTDADTDFGTVDGFDITIPVGMASATGVFDLEVVGDTQDEGNETVTVSGSADIGASEPATAMVDLMITDDDDPPTEIGLSLSPGSVTEGSTGSTTTTQVTVTATLTGGGTRTVSTVVAVTVAGGTATAGGTTDADTDFGTVDGFDITIPVGMASATGVFNLEVVGDTQDEGNETVTVSGSADIGASEPAAAMVNLMITDDDDPPTEIGLSLSPGSVTEGSTGSTTTTQVTVTATLTGGGTRTVSTVVAVTVAGGTATAGVTTDADTDFSTVDGFDITIPVGMASATGVFDLEVVGDTQDEGNETVTVSGSADIGASEPATATVDLMITDDDDPPTEIGLSLSPGSVTEGSTGSTTTTQVTVTATLTGGGTRTVSTVVAVTVAGGTATAGVTTDADTDFGTVDGFDITIPVGMASATGVFNLEVVGDTQDEGNETVTVSGSADIGASEPATAMVDLMITDDDDPPTEIGLSLSPGSVTEGSTGSTTTTQVTVTATLTGGGTRTVPTVVAVTVAGGTATAGVTTDADTDFGTVDGFDITIPVGMASATGVFNLEVVGDTQDEGNETVTVSGSADIGASEPATATADLTITDDDAPPTGIGLSLSPGSVTEGSTGSTTTTQVTVTATLTGGGTRTVSTVVAVTVAGGTATAGATGDAGTDFGTVDGFDITIPVGMASSTMVFDLEVVGDTQDEGNETVTVSGTTTAPGLDVTSADLTITDDDGPPTGIGLSLSPGSVTEGSTGSTTTTQVTVTATLTGGGTRTEETVVAVTVAGGTATAGVTTDAGTDFGTVDGFDIIIPVGMASSTMVFDLEVVGDTQDEGNETVTVSGTTTAPGLDVTSADLTITDDDAPPTGIGLSLSPGSVTEGSTGSTTTTQVTVTATLTGGGTRTVSTVVAVTVAGGTATAGATTDAGTDFGTVDGFDITIPVGMASSTMVFDLEVVGDTQDEGNETVTVSGTTTAPGLDVTSADLTITDDDGPPTGIGLSLSPGSVTEGSTGSTTTTQVTVTATLTGGGTRTEETVVAVTVAGGTATAGVTTDAGTDFGTVDGFDIIIPVGMASSTMVFDLEVVGDTQDEGNETVTVSGTTTAPGLDVTSADLTITDDDAPPTGIGLSLSPGSVTEGSTGSTTTTQVTVTATLTGGGTRTVSTVVAVTVAGGTATAGATGDAGTDFGTVDGFDITIPVGMASSTMVFDLEVVGDTQDEGNETVTVSGTTTAPGLDVTSADLTITDDDGAPTGIGLSLSPGSVTEGSTGSTTTTQVTVTATLTGGGTRTEETVVAVTVAGGTATAGVTTDAGTDFGTVDGFDITIPVGMASSTMVFDLEVVGDTQDEGNETVTVSGTTTAPGLDVTSADLTITDDDAPPTGIGLSLSPGSVTEGSTGSTTTTQVTVTATLTGGGTRTVSTVVAVTVAGGTATAGVTTDADTDFGTVDGFDITIPVGMASSTMVFDLEVVGDTQDEGNETVTVSGTTTAPGLGVTSADLTITDDDGPPTGIGLSLSPGSVTEGSTGSTTTTQVTVTATLTGGGTRTVSTVVAVTVAGGTATAGVTTDADTDFGTVDGFDITIPVGMASSTMVFDLEVVGDTQDEGNETVTVSGTTTAPGLDVTSADLTITDDDAPPTGIGLSLSPGSVTEGSTGSTTTTQVTVTATLTGGGTRTVSTVVAVTVAGGTATAGVTTDADTDFGTVDGFDITIPVGMASSTMVFDLEVVGDTQDEGNETVTVSGTTTAPGLGVTSADLTITDDDGPPTGIGLSLSPGSVTEGSTGSTTTTQVTVTATLTGGGTRTVSTVVAVTVAGGTATAGVTTDADTDFGTVDGFDITIPAGMASSTMVFDLEVVGDTQDEGNETVTVSGTTTAPGLDVPVPGLDVTSADLTITDDDDPPTGIGLSLSPGSVTEGSTGSTTTTQVTVTATLTGGGTRTEETVVAVTVTGGTATAGATGDAGTDFGTVDGFDITIPVGMASSTMVFDLEVVGDTQDEGNETVTVSGTTTAPGLDVTSADLTITDDDGAPTGIGLSLSPGSVTEGSTGSTTTTQVTVTATLTGGGTRTVSTVVAVSVTGGTATEGATGDSGTDVGMVEDFTITIPVGMASSTHTFDLEVVGDTQDEENETLTFTGTTDLGGGEIIATADLTITDDDNPPTGIELSLSPNPVTEGDSGSTTTVEVTVTAAFIGGGTQAAATQVAVMVAGGTATAGDVSQAGTDFGTVNNFNISILAGRTSGSGTFDLEVVGDTLVEGEETLTVLGTADLPVTAAVLTINDNDPPRTGMGQMAGVTISETALTVTEEGPGQTYTVVLDTQPAGEVEITIDPGSSTTAPITVLPALVLTFGTGTWESAQTVTVTATADDDAEGGTRTLSHTVSGYVDVATVAPVTVTVTDDDTAAPTRIALYLDPATVAEDSGRTSITVTASLPEGSPAMATATEVEVRVMDGTATGGADFAAVPEFTVTIAADTTSGMASFDLAVIHDAQVEEDETLVVAGEAVGYTVAPATLTIADRSAVYAAVLESVGAELVGGVFASVSDVVAGRVSQLMADRLSASAGRLDSQASLARGLAASEQALNDGSLSWRKLLDGSFLEVQLGDGADTVSLSDSRQSEPAGFGLWATGDARFLSDDSGDFGAWDSDVFSTHVGADLPVGRRGLGGLAVSSSRGSFNFERDEFDTDTRLLNYTLYYGMPVGDTGSVWAMAGYGTGELVTGQGGNRNAQDMKMTMVAAGGRRNVAWEDGLALDFEGEVLAGRLIPKDADDGVDFATEINRLNFALDLGRRWVNDSGGSFVRSIKLEAQLDDRAPGSGAAIEGRLGYASPASGLTSSLTGDFLLFNEEGIKGGGVSGSLLYRPGLQGRGLSFRADSSYSAGKKDLSRLWRDSGISIGDSSGAAVFELETGYGLPVLVGYGVLTPYYGVEFAEEGARRHRLGNRVRIGPALELEVEGAYLENVPGEHAERRLDLRLRMQW